MRYAVVIEQAGNNHSACVSDLPGCMATGAMTSEVEGLIREAIELHLAGMRQDGETIPLLSSQVWIGRYSLNSDM
ncbi:type II toxin-antitoxin system HicB family antitoxin [uncultured Xanthomonas sp.]|uniref:type II toxin-antitoxin system HicB family antitoxin n=1 Tax=uncultured Xanthomonas sp. TaxID=152831 RepID=UPI00374A3CC1